MPTIHDDIEPWLAASVHDQLSAEERTALDAHLATCETCRALYAEETAMNKILTSSLGDLKPDLAFEQRVVSGFRRATPARRIFPDFIARFFRSRILRSAAAAIVLLLTGVWLTGARYGFLGSPDALMEETIRSDHSLHGLQARLSWPEQKAEMATSEAQDAARARVAPFHDQRGEGIARNATTAGKPQSVASDSLARPMQNAAPPPPMSVPAGGDAGGLMAKALASLPSKKTEPASKPADSDANDATTERVITTGSYIPTAEEPSGFPAGAAGLPDANRKLVRNAEVELEVVKFDEAVQKITGLTGGAKGYVATSSSEKQANGKLRGEVVVKVLPEMLDAFLLKLRDLGELKNQTLGTEDVTKQYFDTDSRLKNARVMETRLIDILKTKSNKVADLLEVEKELGRVRAQIEQMQGELKYMDAQVAFATVTITLTEKDMDVPAAFLLKRRAQLALFSTDVEKTFAEVKGVIDGAKAQISSSTLDRDGAGEATARLVLLIVPEEADALIERIKGMGRVQNYNEQTDRIAQGGSGMAEGAKVERDKVELSITISRNEQEPALQTTALSILTSNVGEKVARLKENAAKSGAEIRDSSFNQNPDGQEFANISLRVAMKNYPALLSSFDQLGKVKDVSVQRQDRRGHVNEETAPADINIRVYSQPSIIADESGLFATVRRTLMQGASALMWSLRMIGVALAFFAPWVLAIALVVWIMKRISRARKARQEKE